MGSKVESLTKLAAAPDRYDLPWNELLPHQIQAADERFQERRSAIKLLGHRAQEAGLEKVADLTDIVPLLFAHTAYKSYPESWLADKKWERMGKWLGTVSTYAVVGVDLDNIRDIDDWIERLAAAGHFVSCSSGTTGKSAMMNASTIDMAWSQHETVAAFSWGANVEPKQDRRMFGLTAVAHVPRNLSVREALRSAFGKPDETPFIYPVPPITIGQITKMVSLRKSIADGTASPGDLTAFESISAERQKAMADAVDVSADALISARKDKLFLSGMWASIFDIAKAVRKKGYGGRDFHPENTIYLGGGLKGAVLPPDYREFIFETFHLAPERVFQMYGMQEINSAMPRCRAGRYHVPPWLICLPLDQDGATLLPIARDSEVEGRAAFFDLALDGRWGGVISGDKISVCFDACACGNRGPSIRDDITRYSDLPGGDKISCSGTIDAYVRGMT